MQPLSTFWRSHGDKPSKRQTEKIDPGGWLDQHTQICVHQCAIKAWWAKNYRFRVAEDSVAGPSTVLAHANHVATCVGEHEKMDQCFSVYPYHLSSTFRKKMPWFLFVSYCHCVHSNAHKLLSNKPQLQVSVFSIKFSSCLSVQF